MQNISKEELLQYGIIALGSYFLMNRVFDPPSQPSDQNSPSLKRKQSLQKVHKKQHSNLIPRSIREAFNSLLEEIKFLDSPTCEIMIVPHLAQELQLQEFPNIVSPLLADSYFKGVYGGQGFLPNDSFVYRNSFTLSHCQFGPNRKISDAKKWLAGGPRKNIFFKPAQVKACIVTCGGLCPGLNVVIREIVLSLNNNYKVSEIYGIQYGYKGFYTYDYIALDYEKVQNIHHMGGTILGSSRGGFDAQKILQNLIDHNINHVYVIGGDGTQKGVNALYQEIKKQKKKIGICGLPKTIDNDIPIIDSSFGFETAVEEAVKAIKSAYVESHSCEFGVGLVRLMGRYAGFIAMEASAASRDVNVCLVPEFQFELYGERGLLEYVHNRLKVKNHCVIVIAEGADNAMKDAKLPPLGKDPSGNLKPGDIGVFLKDNIIDYCKKKGMSVTLKYIDPTYMIRSVAANFHDKEMCSQLAQNATHGLMAGFTGFSVGHVNNHVVFIPLKEIISDKYNNRIQSDDRQWQRLLASTGQPSFLNDESNLGNDEQMALTDTNTQQ